MSTLVEPVVRDEVLDAALAWANEFRSCEQLPKGKRGHVGECPLANATGLMVTHSAAHDFDLAVSITLPTLVQKFVIKFDCGDYPHLDEDQPEG